MMFAFAGACRPYGSEPSIPLTLSFVLRNLPMRYLLVGIAMYAMDIVFTTNVATSLEAWYMDHLSWHWIFWNSAVLDADR